MAKDNDWGYGMPLGRLMQRQFQPTAGADIREMMNSVTPIIGLGMVGMITTAIARGMK